MKELATRGATNLHAKLQTVNAAQGLVEALPSAGQCADWIRQAKELAPRLTY